MASEILMVPFFGQGHLFPFCELSQLLSSRNYTIKFIIPSSLSSSLNSSIRENPLIQIVELSLSTTSPDHHPFHHHNQMENSFSDLLSTLSGDPKSPLPICAVVDVMMSWALETCHKFNIPTVSFFTSGACSAAMEYALWKLPPENKSSGEIITFPGLPDDMCLTSGDLTHHREHFGKPPPAPPHHPGGGPPGGGSMPPPGPPPTPGHKPPWVSEVESSIALMMNTCIDLERPFLEYLGKVTGKPVWGVGPLFPKQYWKSSDSLVHDREIRSTRETNVSEDEVVEWLDSKPRRSVIYVSFGTEVGPSEEELNELSDALAESKHAFIWVLQSRSGRPGPPMGPPGPSGPPLGPPGPLGPSLDPHGPPGFHGLSHGPPGPDGPPPGSAEDFFPHKLASLGEGRIMIIQGWAPQLLILSHPSTAGFISHCGWNSTVEAIGRGVPLLAWAIRGDQYYNAKLVVNHLKVGSLIKGNEGTEKVKKDDILRGIEKLMENSEISERAASLRAIFDDGFPASSMASLDAFRDLINKFVD